MQLLAGEEDATELAELSRGRLRAKLPAMQLAWFCQKPHQLVLEKDNV